MRLSERPLQTLRGQFYKSSDFPDDSGGPFSASILGDSQGAAFTQIDGRWSRDGYDVRFFDEDRNENLRVRFTRDEQGQGLAHVINEGRDGSVAEAAVPIGDVSRADASFFERDFGGDLLQVDVAASGRGACVRLDFRDQLMVVDGAIVAGGHAWTPADSFAEGMRERSLRPFD